MDTAGQAYLLESIAPAVVKASEDASLAAAAREGNHFAFGRLYERYLPMVHGILLARVPYTEVDDLTQDVFLLAFRKLASLRHAEGFGGWLAAIARNRANDYYRREPQAVELDPETASENRSVVEAFSLLEALRRLPQAYRETLVLRLVEGLTGPEIAERTDMTPGSVRVNLHRGMKLLRKELEPEGRR